MIESWRWYGPELDRITLPEVAQTGATGIVNALHEIPYGEVWPRSAIADRRKIIESAGFKWVVAESLPIHEKIKRGDGDLTALFASYRQSMANLAAEGVNTICYNFMPVLDWTRTELAHPAPGGGTCLRFEAHRMAAFEIYMLGREEAAADYPADALEKAKTWFNASSPEDRDALLHAIMSGLPGAFDRYDIEGLRQQLALYEGIGTTEIRENFRHFLEEVIPAAEDLDIRMCVHPDDPPRDILGLPRIVSDADDIGWIIDAVESPSNGLTLCCGSLGANPENDIPAIAARFADSIHFAHLRNVKKDADGSFEEAAHLDGDTDMVAIIKVLLGEESRRLNEGRADHSIPFRPDHGHQLGPDIGRETAPGYPLVGRLRGLAELRGVIRAVSHG